MWKRTTLIPAVCVAVGIAFGWLAASRHLGWPQSAEAAPPATATTESKAEPAKAPIDDALYGRCSAYAKAFNVGDAKAVAALFSPDAEMTGIDDVTIRGRVAIEAEYVALFKTNPGLTITVEPGKTRTLGETLRVVEGVTKIKKAGELEESVAIYTALESDVGAAQALSLLLLASALGLLLLVMALGGELPQLIGNLGALGPRGARDRGPGQGGDSGGR